MPMHPFRHWVTSGIRASVYPIVAAAIAAQPATAAMVRTTGDVVIAPKPTSTAAYPDGSALYVFEEAQAIAFPAGVNPNVGSIPEGRLVDSYLVHFDPNPNIATTVSGSVTFSRPILGILTRSNRLRNSDIFFDAFPPVGNSRGLEPDDINGSNLAVRQTQIDLALQAAGRSVDQVRILVAAPEPTSIAGLVVLGAVGAGAGIRRRKQQSSKAVPE